jgi:biopolymer transport protein TolR
MTLDTKPGRGNIRSDINVTPLVDVCLVLLIILMVVTPILHAGVKVDLPRTAKASPLPAEQSHLAVSIVEDGSVYVRNNRVADADLSDFLTALHAAEPDREVIVRGDRRLGYERVSEVLAILSEVGFKRVGLVTERREPPRGHLPCCGLLSLAGARRL